MKFSGISPSRVGAILNSCVRINQVMVGIIPSEQFIIDSLTVDVRASASTQKLVVIGRKTGLEV